MFLFLQQKLRNYPLAYAVEVVFSSRDLNSLNKHHYCKCQRWLRVSFAKSSRVCRYYLHTRAVALTYRLGDIPSFKLYDSAKVFAFLDINPLSKGHAV